MVKNIFRLPNEFWDESAYPSFPRSPHFPIRSAASFSFMNQHIVRKNDLRSRFSPFSSPFEHGIHFRKEESKVSQCLTFLILGF